MYLRFRVLILVVVGAGSREGLAQWSLYRVTRGVLRASAYPKSTNKINQVACCPAIADAWSRKSDQHEGAGTCDLLLNEFHFQSVFP